MLVLILQTSPNYGGFAAQSTQKLVLRLDSWVKFSELDNGVIDRGGKALIQWTTVRKERCCWFYVLPRKKIEVLMFNYCRYRSAVDRTNQQ
jgi:hypothetical protein